MINTTIHINKDLLQELDVYAKSQKKSKNEILKLLISNFILNNKITPKLFKTVTYQERAHSDMWHTLHVSFDFDIYEKCLDLRKLYKLSVSYLISQMIKLYILKKGLLITDNYLSFYMLIPHHSQNNLNFQIYWEPSIKKRTKKYLQ